MQDQDQKEVGALPEMGVETEKKKNGPEHPTARLAVAVKNADHAAFVKALADGADPLSVSILINAARQKQASMCEELMRRGARPEALDRRGFSALYHAFKQSDERMLRVLLAGADHKMELVEKGLSGELRRGRRGLFETACADGDAAGIKLLLETAEKIPSSSDFILTAGSSSEEAAQLVWSALSDFQRTVVKAKDSPCLIKAAGAGNLWVIALLLDKLGFDVNAGLVTKDARYNRSDTTTTALEEAARQGQVAALRLLIEKGARVDAIYGGNPPLFLALDVGDEQTALDCANVLIQAGANVNALGRDRRSALSMVCIRQGAERRVVTLLNAGANPNQYDEMGETPLHRALRAPNPAMVMVLLAAGADPNLRQGITAASMMEGLLNSKQKAEAKSAIESYELRGSTRVDGDEPALSKRRPGL